MVKIMGLDTPPFNWFSPECINSPKKYTPGIRSCDDSVFESCGSEKSINSKSFAPVVYGEEVSFFREWYRTSDTCSENDVLAGCACIGLDCKGVIADFESCTSSRPHRDFPNDQVEIYRNSAHGIKTRGADLVSFCFNHESGSGLFSEYHSSLTVKFLFETKNSSIREISCPKNYQISSCNFISSGVTTRVKVGVWYFETRGWGKIGGGLPRKLPQV